MPARLPLDLFGEVTTSSGARFKWDANQAPGSRPRNLSFRTKLGEGFSDASLQLARRIDQDYADLDLVNDVAFTGADGSTAYEGRIAAMPRELGDAHSIGVTLAGWMAHAKDRKFAEIYVDTDLSAWRAPGPSQRLRMLNAAYAPQDPNVLKDTNGQAAIETLIQGAWVTNFIPRSEAWYVPGGGITIGSLYYAWTQNNANGAGFNWHAGLATDETDVSTDMTADLEAVGPGSGTLTATTARTAAFLRFLFGSNSGAGADGAQFRLLWTALGAYGSHGLTKRDGDPTRPPGFYASDVIRDIAQRWCPMLDPSGVQDTTYVIQQLAYKDRTYPFDAFLDINKYHLWNLAVWENKRLCFQPYDLTDYDWEIRTDDPGTTFSPQGPSTESLFNGITVTYQDLLTGTTNVLTPETNSELADASTENPWNAWGIPHWDEITLSTPTLQAQALELGRAALADRNRPKTPGTITVKGYIRDRAGNPQPVWKVRAGETISITNFPNDTPRLIVETDYSDEDKTVKLAIDRPFALLDAYLDRQANALAARGLA